MIEIEQNYSKNTLEESISFICSLGYKAFCLVDKELISLENLDNPNQFNNFIFKSI